LKGGLSGFATETLIACLPDPNLFLQWPEPHLHARSHEVPAPG
jgi:hypothetical protein